MMLTLTHMTLTVCGRHGRAAFSIHTIRNAPLLEGRMVVPTSIRKEKAPSCIEEEECRQLHDMCMPYVFMQEIFNIELDFLSLVESRGILLTCAI
jgi:hypothetical protein